MPPKKKKKVQPKKTEKKPRASSAKKKRAVDKTWTTSIRVDVKETPEDSRSSTPASSDHRSSKARAGSMTSRDFIRQVLEFDKAPDSDLDSDSQSEDGDIDQSSDNELKMAIKQSLVSNSGPGSDNDSVDSIELDDSDPLNLEESSAADSIAALPLDTHAVADTDSNTSCPVEPDYADQLSIPSIYAPMPETSPANMPPLKLPPSSDDLIIPKQLVMRATGVYEVLRIYGQIIRLSPFLFEEFLASIGGNEPFQFNPLLHEIHACLIKSLLREEDNNQTSFGPSDLKDSINSSFFFNDAMTYSHVIMEYLRSDSSTEFEAALKIISDLNYPNVSVDKVLTVLETLCNLFLESNSIREELSADGFIKYDDHCRVCQK